MTFLPARIGLISCFLIIASGCSHTGSVSQEHPAVQEAAAQAASDHGPGHDAAEHETVHHKHFLADGAVITDHGIPMFTETQTAGGLSPEKRAQVVSDRLNDLIETHDLEPDAIFMHWVSGYPTVFFFHNHGGDDEGHLIATVDPGTAAKASLPGRAARLAYWWRDVLRDHALVMAGEPPLWTTPYASPMQGLYSALQRERVGVPSHESFELALSHLSASDRAALQSLYVDVPPSYVPKPDDVHAAEGVEHHDHGHHHASHGGDDHD